MIRQHRIHLLLVALTAFTGCHPTQPFYVHEDGDLSHYIDRATEIEHPDVYEPSLEEVLHARAPFTLTNPGEPEFWDLALEEVISIALQNSKVIRNLGGVTQFGFADALVGRTAGASTIYDPALVESDPNNGVEAALSAFDAQLSVLGRNNGNVYDRTDRPSRFTSGTVTDQHAGGLRTELSKRSAVGTQFFARNTTEYIRGNTIFGTAQALDSIWETSFEIEARQPLMRGRGAMINRIPVILARINTDVSLATFESSVRNLVLDIENTYWDLFCAYHAVEVAKFGRDSAQVTWDAANSKRIFETEGTQAEAQSREQYFFFRVRLQQALDTVYQTEGRLRFLMGLAPSDGRLIRPGDEPTAARVGFDWHEVHAESLVRSPELRQQKWIIERRQLELIAARNQLLPQLDVGALYRWHGVGDNLINADRNGLNFVDPNPGGIGVGSTAFDVLTEGRYQEASFFMSLQMPVGYRRELAGVRNAQLSMVREKARLEDLELNTSHLLSTALRNLDFQYEAAQSHFNRWKASHDEVDAAQALYELGKISTDLFLESQRRRAEGQIEYYRALCEYNKALADVHFRKNSLLEYNNIMLAEGAWPEKAYWDALGRARERDASYYLDYGWTRPGVSSQGPVHQHGGEVIHSIEDVPERFQQAPAEVVPAPAPIPSDEMPEPPVPDGDPFEDSPPRREPGPITNRPEGPALNAPRRAALQRPARQQVARETANGFDWGHLGLETATAPQTTANPLRQANYEQPAQP